MHGIVVAGARASEALRLRGVERIHLLTIQGETLLARLCRSLVDGGGCEVVHVLAPPEVPLPELAQVRRAPYSGEIVTDFLSLLEHGADSEFILLGSADTPLITPAAIAALCEIAKQRSADVAYPVCEKQLVEERLGVSKRTYVKLGALTVTGGNVFWLNRRLMLQQGELLKQLFKLRKNPLGLARLFGLPFTLRLLFGWLNLPGVERRLSKLFHGNLCALVLPFPELAVDLDKEADLDFFTKYLDPWN
jgi:molybdopterin-guanine dinucleotide biosynthesis protein A